MAGEAARKAGFAGSTRFRGQESCARHDMRHIVCAARTSRPGVNVHAYIQPAT